MEANVINWDSLVQLASNVGMCVVITIYFLVRDWKFQGTIIEALGKLTAVTETMSKAIDKINDTITHLHKGDM